MTWMPVKDPSEYRSEQQQKVNIANPKRTPLHVTLVGQRALPRATTTGQWLPVDSFAASNTTSNLI